MNTINLDFVITTQGPTYPPSEIMNEDGDFVVIGCINDQDESGELQQRWGAAIVESDFKAPVFGSNEPYPIKRELDLNSETELDQILCTLPLPLPCNNYPVVFAPEQKPDSFSVNRPAVPLHKGFIPDSREADGRKVTSPITLRQWLKGKGKLAITISDDKSEAEFDMLFTGLIPNSLYTVMTLRRQDINPNQPSRPGPLGIPNVFVTDAEGNAKYWAKLPNPFPEEDCEQYSRVLNVVVLWMSSQMSYGGAIGHYGLGGDIHAQLKLPAMIDMSLVTRPKN